MDSAWTKRYFLNERSLKLADNVRKQLVQLLRRGSFPGVDPEASCKPQKQPFLESVAQGLCWNLARKISPEEAMREWQQQRVEAKDKVPWLLAGRAPTTASREMLYKTLRDKQLVHVHPSSALFAQRHNAQKMPEYVVYTDILVTNKQYIRTLTAVDAQWIPSTLRESNAKKPRLE